METATLDSYYKDKQFEYSFSSVCKMALPAAELRGKTILDIACRRGRGVYKLSSLAGDMGYVVGIDWNPAYIEKAKSGIEHALCKSGLKKNNMEFRVAYPENLSAAGIGAGSIDVVYINNAVTLFYDQETVIRECARVLKPGGLLVLETVFADSPRDEEVVLQARALGNSIQAARTQEETYTWLSYAGFDEPVVAEKYEVLPERGCEPSRIVEIAASNESVRFSAAALYVRKNLSR